MRVVRINMGRNGLKERYNRRVAVTIFDKKGERYSESISLRYSDIYHHSLRYFSEYKYAVSKGVNTAPAALKYTKYDDIRSLSNISIPIIKINKTI